MNPAIPLNLNVPTEFRKRWSKSDRIPVKYFNSHLKLKKMFADYESLVVSNYHQKMTLNELSPRLIDPTPAGLRDECLAVFSVRNGRKDEATLRIFFKARENESFSEKQIERCDIAIFRPLLKYLKNGNGKTERKNIELLAWLIDFQPRPFEYGKKYGSIGVANTMGIPEESNVAPDAEGGELEVEQEGATMETRPTIHRRIYGNPYFKSAIIAVFAFAALATAGKWIFGWWDHKVASNGLGGLQRCMYWAGDHYEQVSCNQQFGYDTMVVAFDSARFHNMKKVTSPDTITFNAIGRLWYKKRNNKYEFFTSDGFYPPDPKYRVLPVTERIIMNEIRSRQASK